MKSDEDMAKEDFGIATKEFEHYWAVLGDKGNQYAAELLRANFQSDGMIYKLTQRITIEVHVYGFHHQILNNL